MQQLIQSIQVGTASKGFTWQNNLVFFKGRFFLGSQCPLKIQVLQLVHSSPVAGHSSFLNSYQRAKREFFWHGMKSDIKAFVRELMCANGSSLRHLPQLVCFNLWRFLPLPGQM